MITDDVIKEIYKKFSKPRKNLKDLRLDYYVNMLKTTHKIRCVHKEIILEDLEEYNPFRRFLIRSLNAVLEFDKVIAFVFRNHILFLSKEDNITTVNIKPAKAKKTSFLKKIFFRT